MLYNLWLVHGDLAEKVVFKLLLGVDSELVDALGVGDIGFEIVLYDLFNVFDKDGSSVYLF